MLIETCNKARAFPPFFPNSTAAGRGGVWGSYSTPEQIKQGAIPLNLGCFARCLVARHYHRVSFANLPLPLLRVQGDKLHFKQVRPKEFCHLLNMRR
jgi:hypothetical protein